MATFTVTIKRSCIMHQEVEVKARGQYEALRKAEELARKGEFLFNDEDYAEYEAVDVRAMDKK